MSKQNKIKDETIISNFIRDIISNDLKTKKHQKIITRFPPEPNGYLHIGHAKAICINYGLAEEFNGEYNLRFDDTNPLKEESAYVESIQKDIKWLGFNWQDHLYFASDYFPKMYEYAVILIKEGKAYVDDLNADEIREYRGTLTEPGKNSPYRNRDINENLEMFEKMKNGEYSDGEKVLRAKIDMSSPNINLRDPIMYRISKKTHHRTGDEWCIYPMYDWAHGLEDSIENITHSLCDISFENHRPLYDWFLDQLDVFHPRQIEFSRLNITYTLTSKRKLAKLIEKKLVTGWNDPRLPTLSGLRRRGVPPEAIRSFIEKVGVAKSEGTVDISLLEFCIKDRLNKIAPRAMAVLDPIKLTISNYPDDKVEWLDAINNPEDESAGKRQIPFSKILYIERNDFMIDPPKKFFRLSPGKEIRLKYAYYITCNDYKTDNEGNVTEIICTYDPDSKGGWTEDGRKVKGTSHWVSAEHSIKAEVRDYDRLFVCEDPEKTEPNQDFISNINPNSVTINKICQIEPSLAELPKGSTVQFERQGYYCADEIDFSKETPVFNRTVTLRDTWAKKKK